MSHMKKLAAHCRNAMNGTHAKRARTVGLASSIAVLGASTAMAGTDTTFDGINTKLEGWITGSLGVVFGLGGLVFGLFSLFKQNYAGLGIGIVAGLAGAVGPGIIKGIFTVLI